MKAELTPEDAFLIAGCGVVAPTCPSGASAACAGMDWPRLWRRAERNRVGPLLFCNLREAPDAPAIPPNILASFRSAYVRSLDVATRVTAELGPVATRFRAAGIPLVLLRGLSAGTTLYGDTARRPFTDVDLLIRPRDLSRARSCLEAAGCVAVEGSLGPAYFENYHLHAAYRHTASGALFEVHWALDHRYVPFTIPYESILTRAREIDIGGVRIGIPCTEHDLLANVIHTAKHAYFLPFMDPDENPARRVIDAGCLIHFCDIARTAAGYGGKLDWARIIEESRAWNATRELSAVLRTTARLFPGWLPDDVLERLEPLTPSWIERAAFHALDRNVTRGVLRARPMFRPIRALDLLRYLNPGAQYVRHHYRCRSRAATLLFRAVHPLAAVAELACHAAACRR